MGSSQSKKPAEPCSICQEELRDPRLLPCIHSFCVKCLEQYCKDNQPGDDMACPVCRTEFQIPKSGVASLLVRTHDSEPAPTDLCDACTTETATVYCVDCAQKLCSRCSVPHKKMKVGGPHDVMQLDEVSSEVRSGGSYCEEHQERLRMYCFDCEVSVCSMCCHEVHRKHNFERLEAVRERLARSIDEVLLPVSLRTECFHGATAQVETESNEFLSNIKTIENEVKASSSQLRRLLDQHETDLLLTIDEVKSSVVKATTSRTDALRLAGAEMESYRTRSLELKWQSSPREIMTGLEAMRVRATELLDTYVVPSEYRSPRYTFTPLDTGQLPWDGQNVIGEVVEASDTSV